MNAHNLNIKMDMQHQMFFVMVKGGAAYLQYELPDQRTLNIKKTYVPESSRNIDVGEELVDHVLNYAASKNIQIISTCSFAKKYIEQKSGKRARRA